jgi:hypothetical protein
MELIIEQMFLRCFRDSCFEQAIGEAERDKVEREEKKDREIARKLRWRERRRRIGRLRWRERRRRIGRLRWRERRDRDNDRDGDRDDYDDTNDVKGKLGEG